MARGLIGARAPLAVLNGAAFAVVAAFAALIAVPATNRAAYALLTDEQGPVECLTFLSFLVAAVLAGWSAARARRDGADLPRARVHAALAALCLFAALEEISWGQAFLDIQTPDWFQLINEQGETNLHNLPGVMALNSAFVMAFGIAGLVGVRHGSRLSRGTLVVPGGLAPMFGLIAGMGAIETLNDAVFLGYFWAPFIGMLSEAVELVGAVACLATVWANTVALRSELGRPASSARDGPVPAVDADSPRRGLGPPAPARPLYR